MRIEHAALVIGHPRLRAERAEDRIVERLRRRDIIGADHHMAEHRFPPLQYITTLRMLSPACIRSKPLLISSRLSKWVITGSISLRSDGRRVGKACVSTCRSRCSRYH